MAAAVEGGSRGVELHGHMGVRLSVALCALPVLVAACPPAASAQTQVPDGVGSSAPAVGGVEYGVVPPGRVAPMRVGAFSVAPATIVAGTATVVRVRVDGG